MIQRYRIFCWMFVWIRFDLVFLMGQVCQFYRNCYMYDKKYLNRNYKYYSVKVFKIYVLVFFVCFCFFGGVKNYEKCYLLFSLVYFFLKC